MNRGQEGYTAAGLTVTLAVVAVAIAGGLYVFSRDDQRPGDAKSPDSRTASDAQTLEIKSWPVRIAAFDRASGLAGDVYLNKQVLVTNQPGDADQRPLAEVGWKRSRGPGSGETFINPTIDFATRPGAPLLSVSDGYVTRISHEKAFGRDDYEMHVQPSQGTATHWLVVYDHLVNPTVREGDKVTAGQPIGETGPWGQGQPYNFIELQVNYYPDPADQRRSEGRCPSVSIGDAHKQKLTDELLLITTAWEDLMGDPDIYDEAAWVAPGCITEKADVYPGATRT